MKRYTLTAAALLSMSLAAWSCSGEKKADPHAGHDHASHAGQDHAAPAADTASTAAYPLDICVVSGQKLGSMGEPVIVEHGGRTVKLCCQGCVAAFEKDPAKYIAKLDQAAAAKQAVDPHAGHNH